MFYIFSYYDEITADTIYVSMDSCPSFPYSHKIIDTPIKSDLQDGYQFIRPRFTKDRKSYDLKFDYATEIDTTKIETLEKYVRYVESFKYYYDFPEDTGDPITDLQNEPYAIVALQTAINFSLQMYTEKSKYWSFNIKLGEV